MSGRRIGVVLAVALLLLASCSSGGGSERGSTAPEPMGQALDLSAAGIHEIPPSPLATRAHEVRVWTGTGLVVWGGQTDGNASAPGQILADGATLDLSDGRWTPMPASPFAEGLYRPLGAWDGTEVVIIGSQCERTVPPVTDGSPPPCPRGPAAAAWNPRTKRWRRLPPPPIPLDTFYGSRVLGLATRSVGGDGSALYTFDVTASTIAWDRASASWTTVAPRWGTDAFLTTCADPVARQMVVATVQPIGTDPVPTTVWTLPAGRHAWSSGRTVDVAMRASITCGAGSIVSDTFDRTGSNADLVDLASGTVTKVFRATSMRLLQHAGAVGPWVFTTAQASGSTQVDRVRLVAGGPTERLERQRLADWMLGTDVGSGVVTGRIARHASLWYWRAPAALQP